MIIITQLTITETGLILDLCVCKTGYDIIMYTQQIAIARYVARQSDRFHSIKSV